MSETMAETMRMSALKQAQYDLRCAWMDVENVKSDSLTETERFAMVRARRFIESAREIIEQEINRE